MTQLEREPARSIDLLDRTEIAETLDRRRPGGRRLAHVGELLELVPEVGLVPADADAGLPLGQRPGLLDELPERFEHRLLEREVAVVDEQQFALAGGQSSEEGPERHLLPLHRHHDAEVEPVVLLGLDRRDGEHGRFHHLAILGLLPHHVDAQVVDGTEGRQEAGRELGSVESAQHGRGTQARPDRSGARGAGGGRCRRRGRGQGEHARGVFVQQGLDDADHGPLGERIQELAVGSRERGATRIRQFPLPEQPQHMARLVARGEHQLGRLERGRCEALVAAREAQGPREAGVVGVEELGDLSRRHAHDTGALDHGALLRSRRRGEAREHDGSRLEVVGVHPVRSDQAHVRRVVRNAVDEHGRSQHQLPGAVVGAVVGTGHHGVQADDRASGDRDARRRAGSDQGDVEALGIREQCPQQAALEVVDRDPVGAVIEEPRMHGSLEYGELREPACLVRIEAACRTLEGDVLPAEAALDPSAARALGHRANGQSVDGGPVGGRRIARRLPAVASPGGALPHFELQAEAALRGGCGSRRARATRCRQLSEGAAPAHDSRLRCGIGCGCRRLRRCELVRGEQHGGRVLAGEADRAGAGAAEDDRATGRADVDRDGAAIGQRLGSSNVGGEAVLRGVPLQVDHVAIAGVVPPPAERERTDETRDRELLHARKAVDGHPTMLARPDDGLRSDGCRDGHAAG